MVFAGQTTHTPCSSVPVPARPQPQHCGEWAGIPGWFHRYRAMICVLQQVVYLLFLLVQLRNNDFWRDGLGDGSMVPSHLFGNIVSFLIKTAFCVEWGNWCSLHFLIGCFAQALQIHPCCNYGQIGGDHASAFFTGFITIVASAMPRNPVAGRELCRSVWYHWIRLTSLRFFHHFLWQVKHVGW